MVDVAAQQLGEASTFSEGGALGVCRRVMKPCKGDQGLSWGEGKAGLFMGGKRKLCPWKGVFTTIFLSFTPPLNWVEILFAWWPFLSPHLQAHALGLGDVNCCSCVDVGLCGPG